MSDTAEERARDAFLSNPFPASPWVKIEKDGIAIATGYSEALERLLRWVPKARWRRDTRSWHVPFSGADAVRAVLPEVIRLAEAAQELDDTPKAAPMASPLEAQQDPSAELLFRVEDGVGYITFNRPQARNALTFGMYERLAEICIATESDKTIKALVLTGAGDKAFAAGTDISQFKSFKTAEDALAYEARIDHVLGALEGCGVPTIAAIAGACTGGGGAIAACCDLRIGAANAKFGFPIARTLGNCLSLGNYARLAALIGPARVKDIIFTARLVDAQEARAIGLLNEVLVDADSLAQRAGALAKLVASHAPLTLRATKQALLRLRQESLPKDAEDFVLMCYMSADFREGMDAFLSKRPPQWQGA